jgi:hypothetical protein
MKNYYSISIPKPCQENWNDMIPEEKGRFCDSCSKTVIDFTKLNTYQIQEFINENKSNRICGHFKQSQLDSINFRIPSQVLVKRQNFGSIFLLALLITMGTSLMNCTNKNGDKQKIDSIEVVDSANNETINVSLGLPYLTEIDSLQEKSYKTRSSNPKSSPNEDITIEGGLIVQTVGEIDITENSAIDSLEIIQIPHCPPPPDNEINVEEEIIMGFISVENPPEFKNTPHNFSIQEKRDYFSKHITDIVSKNFNTSVCLDLKGKQKVYTQFKIDKIGNSIDIKARAPHPKLEEEAIRVLKLLPQFIPAKQRNKPVEIVYSLPIVFQVEE